MTLAVRSWVIASLCAFIFSSTPTANAGTSQEEVIKFEDYKSRAETGDAKAQYNLGFCYSNGIGVVKNPVTAVIWWRKSADQGFAEAQHNLADCYAFGDGVTKDYVQAAYWYRKAAEQGFAWSQFNL